ncbi:MAG: hypothetical protein TREMPRED_005195 [Tremellales sp. Tagirdzhanova-0007]|nr:MAG: hypothetical protein TREMPRED_005195 [Tremellales sp. Tagirdzhanova-0007]
MGEPTPLTAYQQTYHWRNKNCGPWAHEWMKTSLPGTKIENGTLSAEIIEVTSVSGDCDLGQRKGKLLTIYDLELEMKWAGLVEDGSQVKGTLKIPEVSHEAIDGLSDYVFDFGLDSSSALGDSLLVYLRTAFPPVLKDKFEAFRPALLAAHGAPDGPPPPVTESSAPSYNPAPPTKAETVATKSRAALAEGKKKVGSTATVEVQATMHASAQDLWGLLTDDGKIPMWSRSAAKMSLKSGTPFELFGGNVRGKVEEFDVPTKLVQSWQTRSPGWPEDHYGTMTITLAQGSDSTSLKFALEGVPVGHESDIERALDKFYIQGLKQMGLGTYL